MSKYAQEKNSSAQPQSYSCHTYEFLIFSKSWLKCFILRSEYKFYRDNLQCINIWVNDTHESQIEPLIYICATVYTVHKCITNDLQLQR